jgi:hypothetical protein
MLSVCVGHVEIRIVAIAQGADSLDVSGYACLREVENL